MLRIFRMDLDYIYTDSFAASPEYHKKWAQGFFEVIEKFFNPKTVIDFGCGSGDLLAPFEKKGVEVLGIDGSAANRDHSEISVNNFQLFDIRNAYRPKKRYDLCICLEVAEHIAEKYSDVLINNLTGSSSAILFSAAPPGQEGTEHINLKPSKWWIDKFKISGFRFESHLTTRLKEEMININGVQDYYINNLLVFKKEA